jgi:hypothetical protein
LDYAAELRIKFLTDELNAMKVTIARLDENGRYETTIARDDGVTFRVKGVAHAFAIPHDLAHFLIEKTLRLNQGFWGSSTRNSHQRMSTLGSSQTFFPV